MPVKRSYSSLIFWKLSPSHPDAVAVTEIKSQKFIGVTIDQFFNWKEHIDDLSVKLQFMGYVFRKLGKYTDINTVKIAYFAYIESRLTYGILAWGFVHRRKVLRRCLRNRKKK